MARRGIRSTREIAGHDDLLRHSSIIFRRFDRSGALASAVGPGRRSAHSRTAMRLRKRCARQRSYWGPSPIDQHANRGDRRVAGKHSSSPAPVRIRVRDMAPAASGTCRTVPSHGRRAAKSSRWALHCEPQGPVRGDQRGVDARPNTNSIASRGVGGAKGRLSARDRTPDGKMVGKALLRRPSDCRFLSALSSCQPDIGLLEF